MFVLQLSYANVSKDNIVHILMLFKWRIVSNMLFTDSYLKTGQYLLRIIFHGNATCRRHSILRGKSDKCIEQRWYAVSKEISSLHFGLPVFCLFEAGGPEFDTEPLPLKSEAAVEVYTTLWPPLGRIHLAQNTTTTYLYCSDNLSSLDQKFRGKEVTPFFPTLVFCVC